MSTYARDRAIESITYNINVSVILISLMAGGTGEYPIPYIQYRRSKFLIVFSCIGLDLTCCNNVILVDPWWNPAVEVSQASSRQCKVGRNSFSCALDRNKHLAASIGSVNRSKYMFIN